MPVNLSKTVDEKAHAESNQAKQEQIPKSSGNMGFHITRDFFHKYFLKTTLPIVLHNRFIVAGESIERRVVCISFDCEVDEDMERIPSLLDELKNKGIQTSFAISGNHANKYSVIIKEILEKGHEIINHSFSHPKNFGVIDENQMKKEIGSFQTLMMNRFRYTPAGFRSPHLMRKYRRAFFCILKENGLYDSSYVGFGISKIDGVVELPLTSCPDHPQVCFDYWHHFQLPIVKSSLTKFLDLWELLLNKEPLINIFFDPQHVSDSFLNEIFRRVHEDFKFLRLCDIAKSFACA